MALKILGKTLTQLSTAPSVVCSKNAETDGVSQQRRLRVDELGEIVHESTDASPNWAKSEYLYIAEVALLNNHRR